MAKTDFKSVDAYMATLPEASRQVLEEVRAIVRRVVPDGDEVISYQIPTMKKDGQAVVYYSAWKKHYSLYPIDEKLTAGMDKELAGYKTSTGTLQFPYDRPVPAKLIEKLTKLRLEEAAKVAKTRKEAKKAKRA
jgi:uncharacterized protein YdhG (YjbR/CyaY superfamily)